MSAIAALRESGYTGLSYDGGRTSLPYAVWVVGAIIYWTADVLLAMRKLREEVRESGIPLDGLGRMEFTG